jgi:hypothetical protein
MKATLEYNLPEDDYDFNCAHNGWKFRSELSEIREQLRSWRKHGGHPDKPEALLEELWERFVVNGVEIEDL